MSLTYIYQKDCLKGEYLKVFNKVELYADIHKIGEDAKNDALINLIDMLFSAQNEDVPPSRIVGNNLKKFCEQYFSDYTAYGRVLEVLKNIYHMMWLILVISTMEMLTISGEKGFDLFKSTTDIMPYIVGYSCMGLLMIIINSVFKKLIFKKKVSVGVYDFVVMLACALFIAFAFFIYSDEFSLTFNIPLFWTIIISAAYVITYIIIRAISNYKKYGSVRKPKEIGGFKDAVFDGVKKQDAITFVKKYEKINNKRERKGLPKLTKEEYMENVVKNEPKKIRKRAKITTTILLGFILICIIQVILTSTLLDSLIFIFIITVIEVPCLRLVYKENTAEKAIKELIKECEVERINVFEYVERLEEK